MTNVTRNNVFVRDERGPQWFEDFLRSFAVAEAHKNIASQESIESVVARYRQQAGLDLVIEGEVQGALEKSASIRKISKRVGLQPIAPMKLKKIKNPDDMLKQYDDNELFIQIKLDGFKAQCIKSGNKTRLFTRRGEEFTKNIPELSEELNALLSDGTFVLGELVWENKAGEQSISDIQTVVGSLPEKAKEKLNSGNGQPVLYVYDILWADNKDITKQPYDERYEFLNNLLNDRLKFTKLVKNYTYGQKTKAINDALGVNAEGIVIKPKKSFYEYNKLGKNEPVGEWAKFKPSMKANTDEVILNKYSAGKDKLIFPMHQYKDGELFEVGKLSGMSKEDETDIKNQIDDGKMVVVEITFQEKMPSGKFRHVGWSRIRPDKSAKEVKYSRASFISIRHAGKLSIIELIDSNKAVKDAIDSMCHHAGGHKNIYSLIGFLREKLGPENVRYSDEELKKYLDDINNQFKTEMLTDDNLEVGLIGMEDVNTFDSGTSNLLRGVK